MSADNIIINDNDRINNNELIKENKSGNKFLRFCNTTVTVIMVALTGYLFLLSIFGSCMIYSDGGHDEITAYLTDSPLLHTASIILIILLSHLAVSHMHNLSNKDIVRLLIGLHGLMAVIMLGAIFICDYYPNDTQYLSLDSAKHLLEGDYSYWAHSGFNYIYPWLNSLTLFLVPEVFLFGIEGGAVAFRIINLVMILFASYSLYGFCQETKLNSTITSIIYILYLPLELYVFFVYGNIVCLSLSIFAIWQAVIYLNTNRKKAALLCAAAISVAALFKDNALIMLIAILIVFLIYGLVNRQYKRLFWIPIMITAYIFCSITVDLVIEGITGEKVPSGVDIYGHLAMGVSEGERANGWYNSYAFNAYVESGFDYNLYQEIAKEAFLQKTEIFFNNPIYAIEFFSKKTASQWNNPTFQSIWVQQRMLALLSAQEAADYPLYIDGASTNMLFYYFFNLVQSMILFGSLCFFVFDARKLPLPTLIPAIAFIGGFIFQLFWEGKAQYTLLFFIMLFPYAATGLVSLLQRLNMLIISNKKKNRYLSKDILFLCIMVCIILIIYAADFTLMDKIIKLGNDDVIYNNYLQQNLTYHSQFIP